MTNTPRALLVGRTVSRTEIVDALRAGGFWVTTADSFAHAMDLVCSQPTDALVTELRLEAYNGLHLILRLRDRSPASAAVIYTDFPDAALERQTRQLGADYLVQDGNGSSLVDLLTARLGKPDDRRDGSRKTVPGSTAAEVNRELTRLVDISHSGFCIDVWNTPIESPLNLTLPAYGVSVTARIVWVSRTSEDSERLRVGVSLLPLPVDTRRRWQRFVDSA